MSNSGSSNSSGTPNPTTIQFVEARPPATRGPSRPVPAEAHSDAESGEPDLYPVATHARADGKQLWREVFYLGFLSLGAIYGDIGTLPLYTLNSFKYPNSPPSKEDVYGGVLCIFYIFTIIVILKYALIVLVFGPNNGEGGQVAIYAKIARLLRIGPKGVVIPGGANEKDDAVRMARTYTGASTTSAATWHSAVNRLLPAVVTVIRYLTLMVCFLGCALVMLDGLLTPTTSVLSAIGGIQVAQPLFNSVLAVLEVVLVCLFVLQQFGSEKLSFTFAPVIAIWLVGLFCCGVYNVAKYDPGVFAALSPYYAIQLLKKLGVDSLGAGMLAITGTEAMFADVGHFGRLPIQLTLCFVVYPCCMMTYLGQAAFMTHDPTAVLNPFFLLLPGGTNSPVYWIMFVLATLGTVIALQALILGVFSILSQLITLDCFPALRVLHVLKNYRGKVYVPAANWWLMVGVCCTTAGFKNLNNVTAAYGLGISLDFILTSILLMVAMVYVFEFRWWWVVGYGLIFLPFEAVIFGSNLKKVPHGGWFVVMIAAIGFGFLSFWRWGRLRKVEHDFQLRVRIGDMFPLMETGRGRAVSGRATTPQPQNWTSARVRSAMATSLFVDQQQVLQEMDISEALRMTPQHDKDADEEDAKDATMNTHLPEDEDVTSIDSLVNPCTVPLEVATPHGTELVRRYPGVGILYTSLHHVLNSPNTVPEVYRAWLSAFPALPQVMVFVGVNILASPTVDPEDRFVISPMTIPGHYRCVVRFGFVEEVAFTTELVAQMYRHIPEVMMELVPRGTQPLSEDGRMAVHTVHVLEQEHVRLRRYVELPSRSPFVVVRRWVRRHAINYIFAPLTDMFQNNGRWLKVVDEVEPMQERLFVGSMARI